MKKNNVSFAPSYVGTEVQQIQNGVVGSETGASEYSKGCGCKKNMMLSDIWAVKARIDHFSYNEVMEITGWDEGIDDNN